MEDKKFDQDKYVADWKKKNMKMVGAQFNNEFVLEFKAACKKLGLVQSQVFRKAMEEVIELANKES